MINETTSKADVRRYSREILDIFTRENICSELSLEKILGESFPTIEGQVNIELKPNGSRTFAITYTIRGKGSPISIRLNPSHTSSLFILEAEDEIVGYHNSHTYLIKNFVQYKILKPSFDAVLEELKRLSSI